MTTLSGLLSVVLRGLGLAGLSLAIGGVAFVLVVLGPLVTRSEFTRRAQTRSLRLIAFGALGVSVTTTLFLLLQQWALIDSLGGWPLREFLATPFALASLARIGLAAVLAALAWNLAKPAPRPVSMWWVVAVAVLLAADSTWLSHAAARLENRGTLMTLDGLHQMAAAIWFGGVAHLIAFSRLRATDSDLLLTVLVLRRFSPMAFGAMAGVVGAGLWLSLYYVGDFGALVGTGYGIMILTKSVLLGAVLVLAAMNFLAVRRLSLYDQTASFRLWRFIEAEVGIGFTILLAAAALTSLPPAVDVVEDRATFAEVGAKFVPRTPRLSTPAIDDLLAVAAPITDVLAERKSEEYAWSEYNHHVAGLFVVAMGLLALLHRTGRVPWARHWPLGFLGLAAFLFVRNDPRAWPLGPAGFWESMRLPDVLQHRAAVLLLVALAIFEWLVRTGKFNSPRWAYVFPLLCAAGGALLLTHSHAMFNLKAEFLVEVTHSPLGVLAVFIGWGRWLELRLPPPENRAPGRLWSVSLVLLGALLLFYREG